MTATLQGNIILSEFMGDKFVPTLNNAIAYVSFDTYAACEAWINEHPDQVKGFAPTVLFGFGCGIYDSDWNWLINAWRKLYIELIERFHKNNTIMERFNIIEHNFHSAIDVNSTQSGFSILVSAVTWYQESIK